MGPAPIVYCIEAPAQRRTPSNKVGLLRAACAWALDTVKGSILQRGKVLLPWRGFRAGSVELWGSTISFEMHVSAAVNVPAGGSVCRRVGERGVGQ